MSKSISYRWLGLHWLTTVVELQNEGFEVVVIDDLSNSEEFVQERIEKITGKPVETHILDLKDQEAVDEFFSHQDIQGIIHLRL